MTYVGILDVSRLSRLIQRRFSICTPLFNLYFDFQMTTSALRPCLGRGHNNAVWRRNVKIYDAAQRIVEFSDALTQRTICNATTRYLLVGAELTDNVLSYDVVCDEIFALRRHIVLLWDVAPGMRRRNAVLWPRPYASISYLKYKFAVKIKLNTTNPFSHKAYNVKFMCVIEQRPLVPMIY